MNSCYIKLKKTLQVFIFMLFCTPVGFFSLLLITNIILIFRLVTTLVSYKKELFGFSGHFTANVSTTTFFAGRFCIGSALLQFSSSLLKKRNTYLERKNLCNDGAVAWHRDVHEFFCQRGLLKEAFNR